MAVTKDHWTLDFRYYNLLWYWYSHFSPFRTLQLGHGGLWDSERLVAEGGRDGEGGLMDDCSCGDFAFCQAFGWNGQDVGHFLSAVGAAVIISQV